jgi:hypothetical protein
MYHRIEKITDGPPMSAARLRRKLEEHTPPFNSKSAACHHQAFEIPETTHQFDRHLDHCLECLQALSLADCLLNTLSGL